MPVRPVPEVTETAAARGQVPGQVRVVEFSRALLDGLEAMEDGPRQVDLAALPLFVDERPLAGVAGLLDWRGDGYLSRIVRDGVCVGRSREFVVNIE